MRLQAPGRREIGSDVMPLEGSDPEVRRQWGRDGMIWGPLGAGIMAIYFVFADGMSPWLVPVIVIASIPIGWIAGVAYYNRTIFLRGLIRRLRKSS
jgi:hypothetical protein